MKELSQAYKEEAMAIAQEIQDAPIFAKYIDSEEEEDYLLLRETYEPKMSVLHQKVAAVAPLQLVALEKIYLHNDFEGLFLPRLLGYSVLRGEVNDVRTKYVLPQNHFKDVLLAICNSANFDFLKKRIGQSIQIGFSLSSDIWITNLINSIVNRRVRYFLQGQKLDKYRIQKERKIGLARYKNQFKTDNYHSADFPTNVNDLQILYTSLKTFLIGRAKVKFDNTSIIPEVRNLIENSELQKAKELVHIVGTYANLYDLEKTDQAALMTVFNKMRKEQPHFVQQYLEFVLASMLDEVGLDKASDERISTILDRNIEDDLVPYYTLVDEIHSKGYEHDDVMESVKTFYSQYEGVSVINSCVRQVIYNYFANLLNNIEIREYQELFNVAKFYPVYMNIFSNQQFNQDLKDLSMKYVRKLLRRYTDKRGKDYQDIKKFVSATFLDLKFLKEKEIVELFKTRRKKKTTA